MKRFALWTAFIVVVVLTSGCSGDSNDNVNLDSGSLEKSNQQFVSECGVVGGSGLENPVKISDGELVDIVDVVRPDLVLVGLTEGQVLVKLPGIFAEGTRVESAINKLEELASGGKAYFFRVSDSCTAQVSGATAYVGQLFTPAGLNYTEELIKSGYVRELSGAACGEADTSVCYTALKEVHLAKSAGQITDFLWKPRAESPYNKGMPVIHANPCNATVYVNGEALLDYGEGNGRCNTSRMMRSCSSYGSNIKVEIIDNETGAPYHNGDDPFVIVPNGCSRYEFKR